jgi:hypothetical protein
MVKTQLNPFHRLYTIKLALNALLLYGKSGLISVHILSETARHGNVPVFVEKTAITATLES